MKYNMAFGIALVCAILFTACEHIADMSEINMSTETGYGRISISFVDEISQTARTVLPSITFDKFEYTFFKVGEADGVIGIPDDDGFFTLEIGDYTVVVQAFIGNEEPYTLAANGISSQFSVGPDNNDPVEVYLSTDDIAEQGEFIYTIIYPAGASAKITLLKWPEMSEVDLTPENVAEGNGKTQTLQLDAGTYLLTVLVSKDDLYAGINEAIHINPLLTTIYRKDFENSDLIYTRIPLSSDYNINGTGTFAYDGNEKIVSITPKANMSPGDISAVYYRGTGDTIYEMSTTAPVNVGTYTVTFDVAAVTGWTAATGLPAGIIIIEDPVWNISLSEIGTYTFPGAKQGYAQQSAQAVTVYNTGNLPTGALTIGLSGANANSFALSTTLLSSIAVSGSTSFTVRPNNNLSPGTYNATVTVSGSNGITANFDVSFTVKVYLATIEAITDYLLKERAQSTIHYTFRWNLIWEP